MGWNSDDYKWQVGPRKGQRFQSAELLAFRAHRPCIVRGCVQPATVDHMISGRTNISSDVLTSSECLEHHLLHEKIGDIQFEDRFRVDILGRSLNDLHLFLCSEIGVDVVSKIEFPTSETSYPDLYKFVLRIEELLVVRGLATRIKVDHKRVNRGARKSKGKSRGRNLRPISKPCNYHEKFA